MKYHMNYAARILSIALIFVMTINSFMAYPMKSHAAAAEKEIYNDGAYKITFKVNSQWDSGFEGQFILENLSKEDWEAWQFQITFPHEIASLWDGEIKSHKGNIYVIQYPSWNSKIPAGGKAVVGFTGKKSGTLTEPSDCTVTGGRNDVSEVDYTITYKVTSDWKDAFNGEISITNNTSDKIEAWQLEFDYINSITSFWTAKLISHEGNHYVIKNDEWNSVIKPGDTIRLGFEAKPGSGKASDEPYNYKLTALDPDDIVDESEDEWDEEDTLIYDFTEEELAIDSDKDGLPDCYEKEVLKTDPDNPDTDGDGLPDGYEIFTTGSDPLVKDSDLDGDEDGLTNLEEYQLKTDPLYDDSDNDSLSDYEEVKKYHTDPNKDDTDGDGIDDGYEILLGLDPTKKDTDGNGIEDGKEKLDQTYTQKFDYEGQDYRGLDSITIQGKFTNYLESTMEIVNFYDCDILATNLIGLVGVPLMIETGSEFDKASVTIAWKSIPDSTKVEDLGILWYNKKENRYDTVDSRVDAGKKQITFETTHFSTYMMVDLKKWNDVWEHPIEYGNKNKAVDACDTAYVVDVSKSMDTAKFAKIQKAMKDLAGIMTSEEKGALIGYGLSSGALYQGLTGDKDALIKAIDEMEPESKADKARGNMSSEGIKKAIAQLKKGNAANGKMLFVIGDADIAYDEALVKQAKAQKIQIFAVNVSKNTELKQLKQYASETGGFYYTLSTMKYLQGILFDIKHVVLEAIDTTDTDGDGLFDVYETKGIRYPNGEVFTANPKKIDTDGDGLTDLEEAGYPVWQIKDSSKENNLLHFKTFSDGKGKIKTKDSDGDGIVDSEDMDEFNAYQYSKFSKNNAKDNYEYNLNFWMNFDNFLTSNAKYNESIAKLSSIAAGLAYYAPYDKNASYYKIKLKNKEKKDVSYTLDDFLQYTGFKATKRSYLGDKHKDNHIVQFNYGYKKISNGKTTKYLVPIIIRGTSGSKEWNSNFTVGKSGEHYGFNTAANRVLAEIQAYLSQHKIDQKNAVLWITGHSRGAAVTNLVAKAMIDKNYTVHAYAFATPAVTQQESRKNTKYNPIFNIINADDFVPRLPLSKWGFGVYGRVKERKLTDSQKDMFKSRVGKTYLALNKFNMNVLIGSFEDIAATRGDCYIYTCACHSSSGKKTGKSITVSSKQFDKKQRAESARNKYKKQLTNVQLASCKLSITGKIKYKFKVCQPPIFFMYLLAETLGSDDAGKFTSTKIAKRYVKTKTLLVPYSVYVKHPHFPDAYILLT